MCVYVCCVSVHVPLRSGCRLDHWTHAITVQAFSLTEVDNIEDDTLKAYV